MPPVGGPDALAVELQARVRASPLSFRLEAQRFVDEFRTPIEDPTVEWTERDAPWVALARVTIPAQATESRAGRALAAYVEHGFADDPGGDGVVLRCRPEHEASVFEHHNAGTFEAAVALSMPIVVAASGDGGDPAEWVRSAADLNPRLTLVNYPDLTHFGPLQEPDRLAVDVALFFLGDVGIQSDG